MTAQAADLLSLPLDRVAVVLVDFQNDFCSPDAGQGRPPTNSNNKATAHRANRFAAAASSLGARIVYTQQVLNWADMPQRQQRWETLDGLCAAGSWGAELYLDPVPGSAVVVKNRFDCWQSTAFTDELERHDIDGLVICGVELVCCLLYAVLGASERGYHYLVPTDLISGQDFGDATDNQAVRDYSGTTDPSASLKLTPSSPPGADEHPPERRGVAVRHGERRPQDGRARALSPAFPQRGSRHRP